MLVKVVKGFCRTWRFLKHKTISIVSILYSKRTDSRLVIFIWTNLQLNFIPAQGCPSAKFSWKWPCCSGVDDFSSPRYISFWINLISIQMLYAKFGWNWQTGPSQRKNKCKRQRYVFPMILHRHLTLLIFLLINLKLNIYIRYLYLIDI